MIDKHFICECGNDTFLFFWKKVRCKKCLNEYTHSDNPCERWMRRFNKKEKTYSVNWERSLETFEIKNTHELETITQKNLYYIMIGIVTVGIIFTVLAAFGKI